MRRGGASLVHAVGGWGGGVGARYCLGRGGWKRVRRRVGNGFRHSLDGFS